MNKPTFVYVTYISTTKEKLWQALTDEEFTKQYWARHRNVSDWIPGSNWQHQDYDDASTVDIAGTVIESDPPNKLVLSWAYPHEVTMEEKVSQVSFEIEEVRESIKLTVTHQNLEADSKMLKGVSEGWPAILSSLKSLLETGEALALTSQRWSGSLAAQS